MCLGAKAQRWPVVCGTARAVAVGMGVHRFEDLECWKLAHALKLEVYAVIAREPARRDFRFCDQIRESARSAPSNIAEGFGRYRPAEFAHFLRIAKASLLETQNHLRDALDCSYISEVEQASLVQAASRAVGAAVKLIRYLEGQAGRGGRK